MAKYEHKKYLIDKKVLNQYKRIKSIDKLVEKFKPSLKYIVKDNKDANIKRFIKAVINKNKKKEDTSQLQIVKRYALLQILDHCREQHQTVSIEERSKIIDKLVALFYLKYGDKYKQAKLNREAREAAAQFYRRNIKNIIKAVDNYNDDETGDDIAADSVYELEDESESDSKSDSESDSETDSDCDSDDTMDIDDIKEPY